MKKYYIKSSMRPATTLLELVFVITILGIVASIGSEIIVAAYESYITQRSVYRTTTKTDLAASQLANRLSFSIPGTVIGRVDDTNFKAIEDIPAGDTTHNILEWIAYDADSFGAVDSGSTPNTALKRRPVWSGYCDVDSSSLNSLKTPGSRLGDLNDIISNLSDSGIGDAAILFPQSYTAYSIGFSGSNANDIHKVSGQTTDIDLTLDAETNRTIKEHYKLVWSAYAVVPVQITGSELTGRGFQSTDVIYDLTLYYDYQPWEGEKYSDNNTKHQVLIRNVSVFNYYGESAGIRLKICQREPIGESYTINSCKEKVVIR
jgi:hypothetical protein